MTRFRTILVVIVAFSGCGSGHEDGSAGQSCTYNGKTYPYGVTWASTDGCHECWCNGAPDAVCDAGPSCDAGAQGNVFCIYDGTTYAFGVTFPSTDGCNLCECTWRWYHDANSGPWEAACTLRSCSGNPGGSFVPPADSLADGCVYNGTTYPTDVYFSSADGCDECHCRTDGLVTCTFGHLGCRPDAASAP